MFNSVRLRLTSWYVGVLTLVLVGFSIGVYMILARNARAAADRDVAAAIDVLQRSLRHEIEEHQGKLKGEESFVDVVGTVYRDSFPSVGAGVYEGARLVAAKPGPRGVIPKPAVFPDVALSYRNAARNGEPWRIGALTQQIKDAGSYQFVATSSLAPVEAGLANLRRAFFLAVPLALAAAALGGFLIARRSFAPVVAMSDTVDRISSVDLHRRVTVANPKDELGRLASTFNRLLERLEGAFSRQKQFMEDSSHELRTPLYVAHAAAQVTLEAEHRSEAEYRDALTTIDQQLQRLNHIVQDMFVLARADAGVYPIEQKEFSLDETVAACIRAARLLGRRRGVMVSGPQLEEMPCRGDEGLFRQMLMNLLDNAVKFTPEGGHVEVEVNARNPSVYTLLVRDSGPGIPEEARAKIFDRFFRVEKARSTSATDGNSGAGLGLAIARWIAGLHGGSLELADTGPQGSTFRAIIRKSPSLSAGKAEAP